MCFVHLINSRRIIRIHLNFKQFLTEECEHVHAHVYTHTPTPNNPHISNLPVQKLKKQSNICISLFYMLFASDTFQSFSNNWII